MLVDSLPQLPPILCYHKIEPRHELGVTRISPKRFARQIGRLARKGYRTVSLDHLLDCIHGRRAAKPDEIVITFDDAYRGLREHAFPALEDHGFCATVFVITDYAGALNRWDVAYGGRRFAHLAWRDMRRWQNRGIQFASHTATHPRLTWLDERAVARELSSSFNAIAASLGTQAQAISYPFGAATPREQKLAALEGYTAGFTVSDRVRGTTMAVPRHPVYVWAPFVPALGCLAPVERLGARGANWCAVGTTAWQRMQKKRV